LFCKVFYDIQDGVRVRFVEPSEFSRMPPRCSSPRFAYQEDTEVTFAALVLLLVGSLQVHFPTGASDLEQIALRWIHFAGGITWAGLLYFFNLVNVPFQKELDPATRGKVVPLLMPRALWWFRWSSVLTVVAGFRYYMILAKVDADNAREPGLLGRWLG